MVRTELTSSTNIDELKTAGHYGCTSNATATQMGGTFPSDPRRAFFMEVGYTGVGSGYPFQKYYDHVGGVYTRTFTGASWTAWGNANSFNCNTASDLASLLGASGYFRNEIGSSDDLNDIQEVGVYSYLYNNRPANLPYNNSTRGFVIVSFSGNYYIQKVVRGDNIWYLRLKRVDGVSWGDWKMVNLVELQE